MIKFWFCWIFCVSLILFSIVNGDDTGAESSFLNQDAEVLNEQEVVNTSVDIAETNVLGPDYGIRKNYEAANSVELDEDMLKFIVVKSVIPTPPQQLNSDFINSKTVEPESDINNFYTTLVYPDNLFDHFLNRTFPVPEEGSIEALSGVPHISENDYANVNETKNVGHQEMFFGINETDINSNEMAEFQNETDSSEKESDDSGAIYDYSELERNFDVNYLIPNESDSTSIMNITDKFQNGKELNETEKMNNETLIQKIDENLDTKESMQNETTIDFPEGSASIDDEMFFDGSGLGGSGFIQSSIDDENGDDDDDFEFTEEPKTTTAIPQNFIEMHKCHCFEIQECLSEIWGNSAFSYKDVSDEDLLTKCSLTFLKDHCSVGGNTVTKVFEVPSNNDDDQSETCSCTENSKQQYFNNQMLKCLSRKTCFLQNHETLLTKMRPFCMEKVKKLTILNALKLSKNEILALKHEYEKTFDEEFVDGRNPHYSNIFTRWFYQLRNKFCDAF